MSNPTHATMLPSRITAGTVSDAGAGGNGDAVSRLGWDMEKFAARLRQEDHADVECLPQRSGDVAQKLRTRFARRDRKALASRETWGFSFPQMNNREIKIYCPKCSWEPEQASRWWCHCGFTWNTFDTGGVCPRCSKAWEETACLSCQAWSRHRDWYHEFIGGREVERVEETREVERTA